MAEFVLVPLQVNLERINDEMECLWPLSNVLAEIRQIVKQSPLPKARKTALLEEIDHLYMHLTDGTRVLCNDVKDCRN